MSAVAASGIAPRRWLGRLSAWHLGFLALDAAYVAAHYPEAGAAVALILLAAVTSELLPTPARRFLLEEALLVVGAGASFLLCVDIPSTGAAASPSFAGWARMVFAYWLLIPARPGLLRWQLSLAIAELLILGRKGERASFEPALWLAPIGVGCLAVDAWLRGTSGRARARRTPRWNALRFGLAPSLVVIAAGIVAGVAVYRAAPPPVATRLLGLTGGGGHNGGGIDTRMHIGDHAWVDKDPRILARLMWDDRPLTDGVVYLRALTLPRLLLDGDALSWVTDRAGLHDVDATHPTAARTAWVVKYPDGRDLVIAPDDGLGAELDDQREDSDGNRFRAGLGDQIAAYRVDLGANERHDEARDRSRFLQLPSELRRLPWATIEDERWARMPAREAAAAITTFLNGHCRYATENLPKPRHGAAGTLEAFLFGEVEERRGHCQYFATACAVLLRRAGHPARCVAGLVSPEHDDQGYVFRAFHAHAWTEVLDEQSVWRRVDATPSSRLDQLPQPDGADGTLPQPKEKPKDLAELARRTNAPSRAGRWLMLALAAAALALAAARGLRFTRGDRPRDPARAALARATEDFFRFAESIGVRIAPHTTVTAVAEQVERRTGVALATHLRAHLDARYGGGPLPAPWPLARLREAMALKRDAPKP